MLQPGRVLEVFCRADAQHSNSSTVLGVVRSLPLCVHRDCQAGGGCSCKLLNGSDADTHTFKPCANMFLQALVEAGPGPNDESGPPEIKNSPVCAHVNFNVAAASDQQQARVKLNNVFQSPDVTELKVASTGPISPVSSASSLSSMAGQGFSADLALPSEPPSQGRSPASPSQPTAVRSPLMPSSDLAFPSRSSALFRYDQTFHSRGITRAPSGPSSATRSRNATRRRNRGRTVFPREATTILQQWLFSHWNHPYPSKAEKVHTHTELFLFLKLLRPSFVLQRVLAQQTGLSGTQIRHWFINNRGRLWRPTVRRHLEVQSSGGQVTLSTPTPMSSAATGFSRSSVSAWQTSTVSPAMSPIPCPAMMNVINATPTHQLSFPVLAMSPLQAPSQAPPALPSLAEALPPAVVSAVQPVHSHTSSMEPLQRSPTAKQERPQ